MAVQDDTREKEMCALIGLREGGGRSDVDAFFDFSLNGKTIASPIELKSTTNESVSTARDVGPAHIAKWRERIWIFGFYDSHGNQLHTLLTLGPDDMEPWISKIENYIAPDFAIGERIADKLELEDVYIICGEKEEYNLDDAQRLHKRQWNRAEYQSHMDIQNGYSSSQMLEILRLRAVYLNERGSTLNNPHIPKTFFANFNDRTCNLITDDIEHIVRMTQHTIREIVIDNSALQWSR